MSYLNEYQFWYFLAMRIREQSHDQLRNILPLLSKRARELRLPFTHGDRAEVWAEICRLYLITRKNLQHMTRWQFAAMLLGFGRMYQPSDFPEKAIERILANIKSPAFLGRTAEQSVVDTFLASGKSVPDDVDLSEQEYHQALITCLTDERMLLLGTVAVTPPRIWNDTIENYRLRRPGFLKRLLSNPKNWL